MPSMTGAVKDGVRVGTDERMWSMMDEVSGYRVVSGYGGSLPLFDVVVREALGSKKLGNCLASRLRPIPQFRKLHTSK